MSQEEFGVLGGVSRAAQSNYETGKNAPDSDYFRLIEAAGVDVSFVVTGRRSTESLEPWQVEIIETLSSLDAEWRAIVLELVRKAAGHRPPTLHETPRNFAPEPAKSR